MRPFEILSVLTALALGGCARTGPSPLLPDPGSDGVYSVDWPELGRGQERYITIDLGADGASTCRRVSPKFPFDSAKARAKDRAELAALASCLNHAEMADHTVLLVGRADARGSEAHNDALGMRRAESVKKLLVSSGLAEARITLSTKGERGAVGHTAGPAGTPEYSHGYDRSVDVVILGAAHAP
jgi:OmpA-OmpF porin, OOP family